MILSSPRESLREFPIDGSRDQKAHAVLFSGPLTHGPAVRLERAIDPNLFMRAEEARALGVALIQAATWAEACEENGS